jgi:peptidoglycan hydrolase-like protein with peptidoglycan-binding domain
VGAFDFGRYKRDMDGRHDARLGAAIIAIKQELVFVGWARPAMNLDLAFYGEAVENSVKDFQKAKGLVVDGECGQVTLKELFRKRIILIEGRYGFPSGTLGKKIALESGFDPVAVGFSDPADKGIVQVNTRIHGITDGEAFDPAFAIPWAAEYVASQKREIERQVNTLKAARAAYNVGNFYAAKWMMAGFPDSGLVADGIDWFARADKYIKLVDAREF